MSDANLGDRANRLSETERAEIHQTLWDTGCMGFTDDHPELFAAIERIVREHTERAWDEAHDAFCPRSIVCSTHGRPGDRHRIYAARQEQDR